LARVVLRAGVAVVARRAVALRRVGADSRARVADADDVALVHCSTHDVVHAGARAALTGVGLRARIAVVAGRAVGLLRVGARARGDVADALGVALIRRRADHRIGSRAHARHTDVCLQAHVALVVAAGAVGLERIGADAGRRIARADLVAVVERRAGHRIGAFADAALAAVGRRTQVAVVARCVVLLGRIRAVARLGIARACHVALIEWRADDGIGADARAVLTGVVLGARVVVVAGCVVRLRGVRAGSVRRVADTGNVALVQRRADDGIHAGTDARLARVGLRTRVPVAAALAVRLGGVRAEAGRRVARSGVVTLIGGRADDGVAAGARAGLAGIGLRAGVAVVAAGTVPFGWVRAQPGARL